jgi:hypothetical protein
LLSFTSCHPYYTQQLAFNIWNSVKLYGYNNNIIGHAIEQIIKIHDYDYLRLWQNFNNTHRKIITGLCTLKLPPLSVAFGRKTGVTSSSTVLSGIKRLVGKGYLIYNNGTYSVEDPYFKLWIKNFTRQ